MNRERTAVGLVLVACLAAAGCPGENRFTTAAGAEATLPEILVVDVPSFVTPNDILDLTVSAAGDRPITAIDLTMLRGMTGDTTVILTTPARQVEETVEVRTPNQISDAVIRVRIAVRDSVAASQPVEIEVPVRDEDNPFVP